jgi:HK97 family phage major capsid protein
MWLIAALMTVLVDPVHKLFSVAMSTCSMKRRALPRLIKFSEHQFVKKGHSKTLAGGRGGFSMTTAFAGAALVAVLIVAMVLVAPHANDGVLAIAPMLATMKSDLNKLYKQIEDGQKALEGLTGDARTAKMKELNPLADEAIELQTQVDRYQAVEDGKARGRAVEDETLPTPKPGEGKGKDSEVVGYLSVGEMAARSQELQDFIKSGMVPGTTSRILVVPKAQRVRGSAVAYVPLTKTMLQQLESKAVPTLTDDVIAPQRLSEIVRVTEQDQLTLLDVINTTTPDSDSVQYTRISSYTRAAAPVALAASKPQAAMEIDTVTETVRTIAVWIPVNNNQLKDFGQLRNMIDTELLWDLGKAKEELIMYGDGTGENFEGIVDHTNVQAARTEAGDTLIDIVRRGITDIRRAGYQPNALAIDPLDWEEIELEKGSDERYVWAVIRDRLGARIWSLNVVETIGAEETATGRRNMVVGDWIRGATLWQREAAIVTVGWINDQFTKNQRTLLAEERAAFGVKRPDCFRVHETAAAST